MSFVKNFKYKSFIYTGEVSNGKPHGKGSGIKNKTICIGTWNNGKLNGIGKIISLNHSIYEGEIKNNTMHGYGILKFHNSEILSMEGTWINNILNGTSIIKYYDNSKYIGHTKYFLKHGEGILYKANGKVIDGMWDNDHLDGKCFIFYKGKCIICNIKCREIMLPLTINYDNYEKYNGECNSEFEPHGYGKMYFNGKGYYYGNFDNGNFNGYGFLKFPNGDYYNGFWKNGKKDGMGIYFYNLHSEARECMWKNDEQLYVTRSYSY